MDHKLYSSSGEVHCRFNKGFSPSRSPRSADVCRSPSKSWSLCVCQLDIDEEEGEQCATAATAAATDGFSVKQISKKKKKKLEKVMEVFFFFL